MFLFFYFFFSFFKQKNNYIKLILPTKFYFRGILNKSLHTCFHYNCQTNCIKWVKYLKLNFRYTHKQFSISSISVHISGVHQTLFHQKFRLEILNMIQPITKKGQVGQNWICLLKILNFCSRRFLKYLPDTLVNILEERQINLGKIFEGSKFIKIVLKIY